jgi:DNA-directed RNA polymerase subunit RPC12/RpoP
MKIECTHCSTLVIGEEVGSYSTGNEYTGRDPYWRPGSELSYTLYKCLNCGLPTLISVQGLGFRGGDPQDPDQWPTKEPITLYPVPVFHINPAIPSALQAALSEAIKTHQAGVHTAAAIMCRRTLDGFCAENATTKRSLAANLEELKDNGTITDQLFEWATALRISGNEAAHDVSVTFSAEDTKDLLDFTVAILDFTYSFRVKFEAFRARRGGK